MARRGPMPQTSWRMNLFVVVALAISAGSVVWSIWSENVIRQLRAELAAQQERVQERRFSNRVFVSGINGRVGFIMEALGDARQVEQRRE